jgi:hypothetical protein
MDTKERDILISSAAKLGEIHGIVKKVEIEVTTINKVVFQGNGQKSILSRLELLENNSKDLDTLRSKVETNSVENKKIDRKYKIGLFAVTLFWGTLVVDFITRSGIAVWLMSIFQGLK